LAEPPLVLFTPIFGAKTYRAEPKAVAFDTVFWKTCQKEIRGTADEKTECNRPIEEREGRSTRIADGQRDSTLKVGQQVRAIGRWLTRGSADGHDKGGIQRNTLDGKHDGGGSVYDWQRVKSF
jgi:hypothetical protein